MVYSTWNFWVSGLYPSSGISKKFHLLFYLLYFLMALGAFRLFHLTTINTASEKRSGTSRCLVSVSWFIVLILTDWVTGWLTNWLTAKLMLALVSTMIFGSDSYGIDGLMSHSGGSGRLQIASDHPPHSSKTGVLLNNIKHSVRTSQETHYISATGIFIYYQNHMKHINTLCGQYAEF
jgi:hypothetical protein